MKSKILVVDDRATNRYLRTEALKKAGYEVLEGRTGREALESCLRDKPALALLDVHLPDVNGLEVCRLIKNDIRTSNIMVLQISASAVEIADAVLGLEVGADDYLIEPVEPALLVAKVRALLRLRAAEEKLRRSNERLAAFAAVASHDLRAPLRGVTAFAQLLQRDYRDRLDERGAGYVDSIVTAGQTMNQLVGSLLEFAQVTVDPAQERDVVPMNEVLKNVLQLNKNRIESLNARITHDELPAITGNVVTLTQVMHNLVENALKYSRPQVTPEIHVAASNMDDGWQFSIRDNGQGFPNEVAEDLFQPFRRFHGNDVTGSGLGLAICRAAVEQYGGRVWGESQGEGAAFFFTIPRE